MVKHYPNDGPLTNLSSFMSGTAVACGTVSTAVTVPTGATSALMYAEGGAAYWNTNGTAAGTTSGGYMAADNFRLIPAIDNLSSLAVYGEAATVVHVEFYQD